jgi:hypothetical protein
LSDFWNLAVAIICMVLVILRMLRTALRRLTIARALAMTYRRSSRVRFAADYRQERGFGKLPALANRFPGSCSTAHRSQVA